ncbi:hypothetical protein Barb6_03026 [Bacteroidales bacterium Barb6]|nr:hypothetical protein Barb6_03026 [Bacteroidales bacterium Barb6]
MKKLHNVIKIAKSLRANAFNLSPDPSLVERGERQRGYCVSPLKISDLSYSKSLAAIQEE